MMPNGESKNWVRFMITLESFYALHDRWPSMIYLYPFFIEELKKKLSQEDFEKLQSNIQLHPDEDNPFLALDEDGNKFDYSNDRTPERNSKIKAIEWLQIKEPDYYD